MHIPPLAPKNYRVQGTAKGEGPLIYDQEGQQVVIDPNSQAFCDFLSCESRQMPHSATEFEGLEPGEYFATPESVIDFCKRQGVTLQVESIGPKHQLQVELLIKPVWSRKFYALYRCVALLSETGQMAPNGIAGERVSAYVSADLLTKLNGELQREDSPVRCLSSWTVDRAFVYVDISDFSKFAPGQQVLIINSLISVTENAGYWAGPGNDEAALAREHREASLCIGDGYIFAFKSAIAATAFGAYLAVLIETLVAKRLLPVEFHFRIGVHIGPVFRFWDFGRNDWNYVGAGITGGQRVLSAVGKDTDDVVFVSSAVRQRIISENRETTFHRTMRAEMQNRGRRADKHGNPWRIYEVNHTALLAMLLPLSLRAGDAPADRTA